MEGLRKRWRRGRRRTGGKKRRNYRKGKEREKEREWQGAGRDKRWWRERRMRMIQKKTCR